MDLTELLDWQTIIAIFAGISTLVAAFKIKVSIKVNFNELLDQFVTYRQATRHRHAQHACPHVYPVDVLGFGNRPGFKTAYMLDEDGGFLCSMCGFSGYTREEVVAVSEAYWSTRTWKDWAARMELRNKILGIKLD